METRDRWLGRLDDLIQRGEALPSESSHASPPYIPGGSWDGWKVQCIAALKGLPGASTYLDAYENATRNSYLSHRDAALSVLHAVRADLEAGYLERAENLIVAGVFADFLDMSLHLLDNGYIHPAVALVGAVLEAGLRRLAQESGLSSSGNLQSLNDRCAQAGRYSAIEQKQIKVWIDVRNASDHGDFDKVDMMRARDMLSGVQRFLASLLG